jgi:hypothetical protein
MKPRHPSATQFQTSGLFIGLRDFHELEKRIEKLGPYGSRTEEQHRGDAFEVFAEAYIAVKHGATNVYPEQEIPAPLRDELKLPPTDKGVDGICKMPGPIWIGQRRRTDE